MSVRDSIRAYNGVANWLNSQDNIDLGKPKRKTYRAQDEHLNNILIRFGKENELKMEKNNSPRYRGTYSPVMTNCKMVQAHFSLFKKWIFENYPKQKALEKEKEVTE